MGVTGAGKLEGFGSFTDCNRFSRAKWVDKDRVHVPLEMHASGKPCLVTGVGLVALEVQV